MGVYVLKSMEGHCYGLFCNNKCTAMGVVK